MKPLLVLWDIDHTLLDVGEAGRDAYAVAFHATTGQPLLEPWQFDGRTELAPGPCAQWAGSFGWTRGELRLCGPDTPDGVFKVPP